MKRKQKTKHLEVTYSPQAAKISREISTLQNCAPQTGHPLEEKILVPTVKELSSESEYYSCLSTLHKHSAARIEDLHKCAPPSGYSKEEQTRVHVANDTTSESQYYTCYSTLSMPICTGIHQLQQEGLCLPSSEMPRPQDLEEHESPTPSPYHHICFHFHLANEPCTPEAHRRKERDMKVYYMHVHRKRGVAVVGDTEEESETPPKKRKVEEMTFPGKLPVEDNLSYVSTGDLLTEGESSWDLEDQEAGDEASGLAEGQALLERPRARTPEWLVAPEHGFKCLGCCRVFASLELLQKHVQHGLEEGFSCLAFHLAFAWLKSKRNTRDKAGRRRRKKTRKRYSDYKKQKGFEVRNSPPK
ncbi:protein FAM170A-like isoform X2 [Ochotona princeps]|uniref:protein FAM170A-like isoform X2 n=1 Tax=Ochotona princeps TaxID=9978 RepID=UPI0027145B32|nr:protein FAM170A-like isoform X2 [Ochotona princeps]